MIQAETTGIEEVVANLQGLRRGLRNRMLRKAMRRGTGPVKDGLKGEVPTRTGASRTAIGAKVKTYKNGLVTIGVVGPRSAYTKKTRFGVVRPANYLHLVERGRGEVTVKKKKVLSSGLQVFGKKVKAAKAQPFLQKALRSTQGEFVNEFTASVREDLIAELAKGKK